MATLDISEIRPETARARYQELLDLERARLVGADGRVKPEWARDVPCPVCGSSEGGIYDPNGDPVYSECQCCGCVYVTPRLKEEALEAFVRHSDALNYFHEHILVPSASTRRERVFSQPLSLMREHMRGGRVLELGSAVGTLLSMFEEAGYEAEGIELCDFSVRYNRQAGRKVYDEPIERLHLPDEAYDGVCAWGVISSLNDPRETMRHVHRVLKPERCFVFNAYNVRSFEYLTLRTRYMNPFVLYQYYTPESVERLLAEAGFTQVEMSTPGRTDVQTVCDILGGPSPELGAFLNAILFEPSNDQDALREALQVFLAEHKLSGNLVVRATKS